MCSCAEDDGRLVDGGTWAVSTVNTFRDTAGLLLRTMASYDWSGSLNELPARPDDVFLAGGNTQAPKLTLRYGYKEEAMVRMRRRRSAGLITPRLSCSTLTTPDRLWRSLRYPSPRRLRLSQSYSRQQMAPRCFRSRCGCLWTRHGQPGTSCLSYSRRSNSQRPLAQHQTMALHDSDEEVPTACLRRSRTARGAKSMTSWINSACAGMVTPAKFDRRECRGIPGGVCPLATPRDTIPRRNAAAATRKVALMIHVPFSTS